MRWAALGLLLLGLPAVARADERFDHRGAVGLLLNGGVANWSLRAPDYSEFGFRGLAEIGGTWAIDVNGNELVLLARGAFGPPPLGLGLSGGYRSYFGYQQVKTFLDLQVAVHIRPTFLVGPRVGGGFQYELTPNVGVYLGGAVNLAFGNGLLLSGEVLGGVQLRSYLLE